jgi:hypothetical protein
MARVDGTGSADSCSSTVAIIMRAVRLGLFTAAEAELLIDRVRPRAPTALSGQDANSAGPGGQPERDQPLIGPDRTIR